MGKHTNKVTMKKFTPSHEWIHIEDNIGTVGITGHAQKELGEVVYIELPVVGKQVKGGEEVVVLESTKAAADIYSPVSGEIVAINEALKTQVNLINTSPEIDGWLFKISILDPDELNHHLDKSAYTALIKD